MRTISPCPLPLEGDKKIEVVETAIVRHVGRVGNELFAYIEADFSDGPLVERILRVTPSNQELSHGAAYIASSDILGGGMRHVYLLALSDSGLGLSEEAEEAYRLLKNEGFFIDNNNRAFEPGENDRLTAEQTVAVAELELAGFIYNDPADAA